MDSYTSGPPGTDISSISDLDEQRVLADDVAAAKERLAGEEDERDERAPERDPREERAVLRLDREEQHAEEGGRGTDERELPHPADRERILLARHDIRAGAVSVALPGLRLAAVGGDWLTVDVEVSPLPHGPDGAGIPHFALARIDLRDH